EMVAFMGDEHLRLVLQTPECGRMNDAVAVTLERGAGRAFRLRHEPSPRSGGIGCIRRARPVAEAYSLISSVRDTLSDACLVHTFSADRNGHSWPATSC